MGLNIHPSLQSESRNLQAANNHFDNHDLLISGSMHPQRAGTLRSAEMGVVQKMQHVGDRRFGSTVNHCPGLS